jgi:hypothetical protein
MTPSDLDCRIVYAEEAGKPAAFIKLGRKIG